MSDPRQHIMPVYRPPEEAFERGDGVRLTTEEGRTYLDFVAGIAVSALGHSHPAMVEALQEQAGKLWHTSNMFRVPAGEDLRRLGDRPDLLEGRTGRSEAVSGRRVSHGPSPSLDRDLGRAGV